MCVFCFVFLAWSVRLPLLRLCVFYTSLPLPSLARLPDGREHRVDRSDLLNDEALSANFAQRVRFPPPRKTLIPNVSPLPKNLKVVELTASVQKAPPAGLHATSRKSGV